ncbi:hypothetical protein ES703_126001 [subsurface metagenome]
MSETGKKVKAEAILQVILDELVDRSILSLDMYENEFGCKSFDEVAEKVKEML